MRDGRRLRDLVVGGLAVAAVAVVATGSAHGQTSVPDGEWHHFGRDGANTKYSPLDQITAENFTDLEIAWRWTSLSRAVAASNERIRPSAFKSSPLMANGLVYVSTALGQAAGSLRGRENAGRRLYQRSPFAHHRCSRRHRGREGRNFRWRKKC